MTVATNGSGGGRCPVLEVRGLCVEYAAPDGGSARVVQNVDLTLGPGETLGLAGESGSGKSTLAAAATRLLRPPGRVAAGEVRYRCRDGTVVDLLALSEDELRPLRWEEIAVVFQSAMNALNPVRDIASQLTDSLEVHRPAMGRRARTSCAQDLLDAVGVPRGRLQSFPHELSGGMRQRVMIAMSLVLEPALLVLDEPTTALDVVVQRAILARLAELRQQLGFAVLFITHDLSLLMELVDTIAVMYAGRIVEVATSEQIHRDPLHPYTEGLLDSFPSVHGPRRTLTGIPGNPPDPRHLPAGCAFAPRCPHAFGPCATVAPALETLAGAPGRRVACHLHPGPGHGGGVLPSPRGEAGPKHLGEAVPTEGAAP